MQWDMVLHFGFWRCGMTDAQDFDIEINVSEQQSVGGRGKLAAPVRFFKICLQHQRGCGFCSAFASDEEQKRRSVFDDALKAEPRRQRNAVDRFLRKIAQVERDDSESAALQQQVGTAQNLI